MSRRRFDRPNRRLRALSRAISGTEAEQVFSRLARKDYPSRHTRTVIAVSTKSPYVNRQYSSSLVVSSAADKLWNKMESDCKKWAADTVATIQSLLDTPGVYKSEAITDTGNLCDAIGIIEESYDKGSGKIHIQIGVRQGNGPGKIGAPPWWLYSPKYGRKSEGDHKGQREMPDDDYSHFVIGSKQMKSKRGTKYGGYPVFKDAQRMMGSEGIVDFGGYRGSPRLIRDIQKIAKENAKKIILGK